MKGSRTRLRKVLPEREREEAGVGFRKTDRHSQGAPDVRLPQGGKGVAAAHAPAVMSRREFSMAASLVFVLRTHAPQHTAPCEGTG
jgi:hypothetical protein